MNTTLSIFLLAVLSKAQASQPATTKPERRYAEVAHVIVVTDTADGQKQVREIRTGQPNVQSLKKGDTQ